MGVNCLKLKQKQHVKINKLDLESSSRCDICGSKYTINGPVWLDPLNDLDFVAKLKQQVLTLDPAM